MTTEELQEILDWAAKRDAKLTEWLKHLILLATGALSILVALQPLHTATGLAAVFQKGAWVSLGLGILLGSISLYAAVWQAKKLVKLLVKMRIDKPKSNGASQSAPISVKLHPVFRIAERGCYISLTAAVICLVGFGMCL